MRKVFGYLAAIPPLTNIGIVLALLGLALPMLGIVGPVVGAIFLLCALALIAGGILPKLSRQLLGFPEEPREKK